MDYALLTQPGNLGASDRRKLQQHQRNLAASIGRDVDALAAERQAQATAARDAVQAELAADLAARPLCIGELICVLAYGRGIVVQLPRKGSNRYGLKIDTGVVRFTPDMVRAREVQA